MGTYGLGASDRYCRPTNDGTEEGVFAGTPCWRLSSTTAGRNDELELERELTSYPEEGAYGPPPAEVSKST